MDQPPRSSGFVSLRSLRKGRPDPAGALSEIRAIYFATTRRTIHQDLARAIELLGTMPTEDDREKARVYLDGLSQMRSEWSRKGPRGEGRHDNRRRRRGGPGTE